MIPVPNIIHPSGGSYEIDIATYLYWRNSDAARMAAADCDQNEPPDADLGEDVTGPDYPPPPPEIKDHWWY